MCRSVSTMEAAVKMKSLYQKTGLINATQPASNPTCKRSLISISPSLSRQVQVIDPLENGARKIDLFDISPLSYKISIHAGVAELADALRSGRSEHSARESSNLSFGTTDLLQRRSFLSPKNRLRKTPSVVQYLQQRQ